MSLTARWTTASAALVWLFAPGAAGTPLSGVPFTDVGVFIFVWVWVLLFLVLPIRTTTRGLPWVGAIGKLIAIKLLAGAFASPHGLTGTYRCLVAGSENLPAWRRIDPELRFDDNGTGLGGRTFHLLFYNSRAFRQFPKPALEQAVEPGREAECLDLCGLEVTWHGTIRIPDTARYSFRADTDGEWSVSLNGRTWSGAPGRDGGDARHELPFGVHAVTVKYVHPTQSAATPRRDQSIRFRLQWSAGGPMEDVPPRLLSPGSDNRDGFGGTTLGWLALLGICCAALAWLIRAVDWPPLREVSSGSRLIVFALALGVFCHGAFRTARAALRDPHGSTLNTYDYKTYLMRAMAYWADGEFVGEPKPGPVTSSAAPIPPPTEAEFHTFASLDAWLRTLAGALDGRLGPIRFSPDAADTSDNRLHVFYRNPLMEYYVAGLLRLFGERLGLIYLFHALTASAAVALVYLIGRMCFGRAAGLLGASALALDFNFVRTVDLLMAEQPSGLLVPAALAAVMLARRSGRWAWFAGAGAALAACFLLRPNLALLLPPAVGYLLLPGPRAGGLGLGRRAAGAAVTVLVFGALWSLLPVRNQQLGGRPLWGVTCGPTVIINGLRIPVDRPLDKYIDEAPADRREWLRGQLELFRALSFDKGDGSAIHGDPLGYDVYPEINPVLERIIGDYIRENPGRVAGQWVARFWNVWGAGGKWYVVLYLAVLAAAAPLVLRRRGPEPLLLLAAWTAITIPLVAIHFEDRLRAPALPVIHVFTGAVLWSVVRRIPIAVNVLRRPR